MQQVNIQEELKYAKVELKETKSLLNVAKKLHWGKSNNAKNRRMAAKS